MAEWGIRRRTTAVLFLCLRESSKRLLVESIHIHGTTNFVMAALVGCDHVKKNDVINVNNEIVTNTLP
jgi:hypothetical protein